MGNIVIGGDINRTIGIKAFNDIQWRRGRRNFDYGSGKNYKIITNYLLKRFGVINICYDPNFISQEENKKSLQLALNGDFDTTTSMSILNIIKDKNKRLDIIKIMKSSLKKGGVAYFKIFHGMF